MKISTKGRYAVRLLYDLAQHNTGEWISLKDVWKETGDFHKISGADRKAAECVRIFEKSERPEGRVSAF